jgi:4-hydroxy-3-polyprenylbenzoate decarboxylase
VRETPLNLIHLRNLTTLAEAGAVVLPASPSFYSHPADIEELCATVTDRITARLGLAHEAYRWTGKDF